MGKLESALILWINFLSALGFDAGARLNPPASAAQLAAVEAEIGRELPGELRALYLYADGQTYEFEASRLAPGERSAALFGRYTFSPLAQAVSDWRGWGEVVDAAARFDAHSDPNAAITVREGDPVDRVYYQKSWFPFTADGAGNAWAVDLDPPRGGTVGQIIQMGPDFDERRVVASSLSELFERAAEELDGAAILAARDEPHILAFEMDWRRATVERAAGGDNPAGHSSEFSQAWDSFSEWLASDQPTISTETRSRAQSAFLSLLALGDDPGTRAGGHASYCAMLALEAPRVSEAVRARELVHEWMVINGSWTEAQAGFANAVLRGEAGAREKVLASFDHASFGEGGESWGFTVHSKPPWGAAPRNARQCADDGGVDCYRLWR